MLVLCVVVSRTDIGELKSPQARADGSLVVEALLTRCGVFEYRNDDGSPRFEYRPESEVFDAESLASFGLVAVTNNHPESGMVSAATYKSVAIGTVGENVRRHDNHVAAPLVIRDAQAIEDINEGKQELSCGYHADMDDTPGVSPEGIRYDTVQRKIRGNHVAIVDVGRAGPNAKIRMDAGTLVTRKEESSAMDLPQALLKIAEMTIENIQEKARADVAESSLAKAVKRADTSEAAKDVAEKALETAKVAKADAVAKRDADINEAVQLRTVAQALIPDTDEAGPARFDGKSNKDLKIAVVTAVQGKFDTTKSDDYLQAVYDLSIKGALDGDAKLDSANALGNLLKKTPKVDAEEKAKADMMERYANASKVTK